MCVCVCVCVYVCVRGHVYRMCTVILACRNVDKGEALASTWRTEMPARRLSLEVLALDMSSLKSVRSFARNWRCRDECDRDVHVLINNAGVFDMSGKYCVTSDGFESHFGVNYLGQVLLTIVMMPWMKRQGAEPARVVMVSSKLSELGRVRSIETCAHSDARV